MTWSAWIFLAGVLVYGATFVSWPRRNTCDRCRKPFWFAYWSDVDRDNVPYAYCSRKCLEENGDRDNPRRNSGLW